jgi:hypothetical protein
VTTRLGRILSGTTTQSVNLEAMRPRRSREHPIWCHVARCLSPYADPVGGHRSEPLTVKVPGHGNVTMTLTQRAGGQVHIDATVTVVVPVRNPAGQIEFARKLLADLAESATTTAGMAQLAARRDELVGPRRAQIATGGH